MEELAKISWNLSLILFSVSFAGMMTFQTSWPNIERAGGIWQMCKARRTEDVSITICCQSAILISIALSAWSLVYLSKLRTNKLFLDHSEALLFLTLMPFIYLAIPRYVSRLTTSISWRVIPRWKTLYSDQPPMQDETLRAIFRYNSLFTCRFRILDSAKSLLILTSIAPLLLSAYSGGNGLNLAMRVTIPIFALVLHLLPVPYDRRLFERQAPRRISWRKFAPWWSIFSFAYTVFVFVAAGFYVGWNLAFIVVPSLALLLWTWNFPRKTHVPVSLQEKASDCETQFS